MEELIKLLDKDLEYISHEMINGTFYISARSVKEEPQCPYCGKLSSAAHSYYERIFDDLPLQGKPVVIRLITRRMFCTNPDCSYTTFAERYPFLKGNAKQTRRLQEHIIDIALETSSVAAAEVLRRNAVKTSKSTICLMLKKSLPLWIKDTVQEICVDDFAIRKNHTYGTVMIDAVSHQTIDMLPSRETSEVSGWLKKYPGLRIVSRDGSVSYAAAITGADAQIMQVSDRFHLIKGLSDVCRKEIQTLLHANFVIPSPGSHYEGEKEEMGYWKKKTEPDVVERTHEKNRERKLKLVEQVRGLSADGMSKAQIARQTGLAYSTVKRYLNPDFPAGSAGYDQKHASKIKPYEETIRTLLKAGKTFKEIETVIKEQGYDGASSTIRMYATRERKLLHHAEKTGNGKGEVIERKWLIKLLYRPIDKISGITEEQLGRVIEQYPLIGKLYDQMTTFKETLF